MKRFCIYLFSTISIIISSCAGEDFGQNTDVPIFIDPSGDSFYAKSVFEPGNFNTPGNALRVYDKFSSDVSSSIYINGEEVTSDGTNWNFETPKYWTRTGSHSFTAYASKNIADGTEIRKDGSGIAPVAYNGTDETLNVGPWTITADRQFDFIYAHHTRQMTETNPYRPVELQMKHLLCAVQFNLINLIPDDTNPTVFKSFQLNGIYRTGTAAITKSGNPQVNIVLEGNDFPAFEKVGDRTLTYNESYNILSGTGKIGNDGYMLVWPHPNDRFNSINAVIRYSYNSNTEERQINLNNAATNNWRAGYRYVYNLYLHDNKISFEVKVLPWIVDDVIIDG